MVILDKIWSPKPCSNNLNHFNIIPDSQNEKLFGWDLHSCIPTLVKACSNPKTIWSIFQLISLLMPQPWLHAKARVVKFNI
jgi:hypothetical protein